MKYIKKFENNNLIEVGDYVLIKTVGAITSNEIIKKSKEFVDTHIGKCLNINNSQTPSDITIVYENIPSDIHSYFLMYSNLKNTGERKFQINRVIAYGKTIEEVEIKKNASKYNL